MAQKLESTNDFYIEEIITNSDYDIRPNGEIWTLIQKTGKRSIKNVWRLAGTLNCDGYIEMSYNNRKIKVHRVIYRKFNGQLDIDLVINHKDGVRSNNRPDNLELVTQSDNIIHKYQRIREERTSKKKR